MTYRGRVKNGVVVLEEDVSLPDGAEVEVVLSRPAQETPKSKETPTLYEQFKDIIGSIKDLPPDFAENHDHYIHGCLKK